MKKATKNRHYLLITLKNNMANVVQKKGRNMKRDLKHL
jgi:hypothetical protein